MSHVPEIKKEVSSNDKSGCLTLSEPNTWASLFHRQTLQTCCFVWTALSVYLYRFQTNSCWKDRHLCAGTEQRQVCCRLVMCTEKHVGIHTSVRGQMHTHITYTKYIIHPRNTWYVFSRCSISQLLTQTWRSNNWRGMHTLHLLMAPLELAS